MIKITELHRSMVELHRRVVEITELLNYTKVWASDTVTHLFFYSLLNHMT